MIGRLHRVRRTDDRGATLVLALIVITVIAVGVSVLLSFADTSIRTTLALRDQAAETYNADGAMQAAINGIRNSGYNASPGQSCFGTTDTLSLPNFYGADSAAVSCAADPAKVLIQCPSLTNCNRPGSAILTLGKIAGEDGLNVQQPTGSTFRVHGAIFSNSNINVVNGTLDTNTRVYARGACAGTITSTPAPNCNYGTTANPLGDDPGYAPASATVPAYRPLPPCTTPNSVVTFEPGYYDDAVGLSDMMAGNSACRHSTWWFKPGTYYFDFHNTGSNSNPLLNSGGNIWTVDDGYLVAGTPVNAAGAEIASPPVPAVIPGSCDNPIDNARAKGVQFIFGGDSRIEVKAAQAEICGTYRIDKPPVAIYGMPTGTDAPTALTGADTLKPTAVPTPGAFGASATTTNLANVDGANFATWKSKKKNDSGTVTVSGFAPPSAIPAGSVLTSAVVRVAHRHSDTSAADSLRVTLTPSGSGSSVTATAAGRTGSGTFATTSIPLDTARTGALAAAIHDGTFTGASIALTVDLSANNDTEDVDAIQLDLTYVAPAYRAATGCVTAGPYTGTGSSSCAVVKTVNTSGNRFYVQGTTYTPKGALDITLNNAAEQVFRFGVVARSLWVKLTGSFSYNGVVIEVPDDSPGFAFSIYLTAYVCPGTNTCAPSGSGSLRAKVAFVDEDPVTPTPGRRQVIVLSWSSP